MAYTYCVIKKEQQKTNEWSGGTTTQLYIYPEGSEYRKRNFLWRLSSASVNLEESDFTHLPGIWRYIMILDGQVQLHHEGHHSSTLGPYEQDSFSGEWKTHCIGRAKDFNLMLADGCNGRIYAIHINGNLYTETVKWDNGDALSKETAAYYCVGKCISMKIDGNYICTLNEGDLLLINKEGINNNTNIEISGQEEGAQLIAARISY